MCGIVGYAGTEPATPVLFEGLRRLEPRGYDSAGIATIHAGRIDRRRATGKLDSLADVISGNALAGNIGIGHTRWATHGPATECNTHPLSAGRVTVVHNGIIENYRSLRRELIAREACFTSETDTEVAAHMMDRLIAEGATAREAVLCLLERLEGMFALAFLISGANEQVIGIRRGAPLVVGWGKTGTHLASNAVALSAYTRDICFLEENDFVIIDRDDAQIHDASGEPAVRERVDSGLAEELTGKEGHEHFMYKEIREQADALRNTLRYYVDFDSSELAFPEPAIDFTRTERVMITGCGTAYFAAQAAKYHFEHYARLPADVDISSEFRYRQAPMPENGCALFVSQSGETADTLAALRECRANGQLIATVTNTPSSSMARESDCVIPTIAGPESGVAATKTFTSQLVVLTCLALKAATDRKTLDTQTSRDLLQKFGALPALIEQTLETEDQCQDIACELVGARDALFLGRGTSYVVAMEGALKLKEVSYIHAEAYAAGEMKHGPIALIEEGVPVFIVAPHDRLFEKTMSNASEAAARGGNIILITDEQGAREAAELCNQMIVVPMTDPLLAPIVLTLPVQLIAYHAACMRGEDPDKPRNLAKTVTVE